MAPAIDTHRALAMDVSDGIWDIALGLSVGTFALAAVVDVGWLPLFLAPAPFAFAWLIKSRIGSMPLESLSSMHVDSDAHRTSLWIGVAIIILLGLLIPMQSMASNNGEALLADVRRIPAGLALASCVAIIGPLQPRWYWHAGTIATLILTGWVFHWPSWADFSVAGVIILITGVFAFEPRFLQDRKDSAGSRTAE